MSLLRYALVAAAGYYAGQPAGRRQLDKLMGQAKEAAQSPKAAELTERGKTLAGQGAARAVGKVKGATSSVTSRSSSSGTASSGTGATDPGIRTEAGSATPSGNGTLGTRTSGTGAAGTGTGTGAAGSADPFDGRTVAEDSAAVRTGVTPPPPATRTAPGEAE
ncbi:hypothetical protein [Pseudonocardia broussonetiae]|uniref:YtxH domain-containing protein n=1 Tax=Pseudonocardia broussonetiae TaxID=2736640 RepID=A0A6M6JKG3_9PSEU|nr:hypothetical protein [Pseudonocardia broussonetiae]QJY47540.1 hypothetical protein HOP40_18400 [Pseudonocardia broussonetiae]